MLTVPYMQDESVSPRSLTFSRLDSDTKQDSIALTEVILTDELKDAAKTYLYLYTSSSQPISGWSKETLWNASEGFTFAQRHPLSTMNFLDKMQQDKDFLDPKFKKIFPGSQPTQLRRKFQDFGTEILRYLESVQFSVVCTKDLHQFYTILLLTPDVTISYMYGTLVHRNLSGENLRSNNYGQWHHSFTLFDFKNLSIPVLTKCSVFKWILLFTLFAILLWDIPTSSLSFSSPITLRNVTHTFGSKPKLSWLQRIVFSLIS